MVTCSDCQIELVLRDCTHVVCSDCVGDHAVVCEREPLLRLIERAARAVSDDPDEDAPLTALRLALAGNVEHAEAVLAEWDEAGGDDTCRSEGCDASLDDGEGQDGYCGNCADRLACEEHGEIECEECSES